MPVGVAWVRGQRLDITGAVREGANELQIKVTNTLINRVSGLKGLPPVPNELRERYGGDLGVKTSGAKALIGYKPLPNSGLLGPVTVCAFKRIQAPLRRNS
jgi:hypothetical protein